MIQVREGLRRNWVLEIPPRALVGHVERVTRMTTRLIVIWIPSHLAPAFHPYLHLLAWHYYSMLKQKKD